MSSDLSTAAPRGAYCDLSALVALRHGARDLDLGRQGRVFSLLVGHHQSRFRGRGIEFEEVRAYQVGDDIRSIDWRVTARTGKAHTKLFREERERPVILLVDQSLSMFFGSRTCCKSVSAAHAAAVLAWAAVQHNDRVGGLVFDGRDQAELRPRSSSKNVLQLISLVDTFNHRLNRRRAPALTGIDQALEELRRIVRPGSNLFLISDFQGMSEAGIKQLHLLRRHNDIVAVRVYDPLEEALPAAGNYTVTDGSGKLTINASDRDLRRRYQRNFAEKTADLAGLLGPLGIPFLSLSTLDDPGRFFRDLLGRRR